MQTFTSYRIVEIQLEGIRGCIEKYTSGPSIICFCEAQKEAVKTRDKETLLYTCTEMLKWYEKNIDEINANPFCFTKNAHTENISILNAVIQAIKNNPDWFSNINDDFPNLAREKKRVLFISHSSRDAEYVGYLVDLLRKLTFNENNLFCSSYPGFGIPLGEDIYSFLKSCFENYELFVLFVISKNNYYVSPASLNEMGAAWVQGLKSIPILLPNMSPSDLQGVVSSNSMSVVIDSDSAYCQLNSLKQELVTFFNLASINESAWERDRELFLSQFK